MKAEPIPVFLDTEFSGLDLPSPSLISLGLVTLSGEELYIELEGIEPEACSSFVRSHVLSHLGEPGTRLSIAAAADKVKAFIERLPGELTLVSDAPQFDFAYVKALLAGRWPANLRRKAFPFSLDRLGPAAYHAARGAFADASRTLRPHHALDDARLLKAVWIAASQAGWRPYWDPVK
jgi:DNA polymerase III epsilon subunit-like protein